MRNIKFRGRRVDNKERVFGSLIRKRNDRTFIHFYDCNNFECLYEVDPATVGQFTELYDGEEELYEGDIITAEGHFRGPAQIIWDKIHKRLRLRPLKQQHYDYSITIVLDMVKIGNIHEHPHLLVIKEEE